MAGVPLSMRSSITSGLLRRSSLVPISTTGTFGSFERISFIHYREREGGVLVLPLGSCGMYIENIFIP